MAAPWRAVIAVGGRHAVANQLRNQPAPPNTEPARRLLHLDSKLANRSRRTWPSQGLLQPEAGDSRHTVKLDICEVVEDLVASFFDC